MKIKITSIDKRITNYEGKSIALIVGQLDIDKSHEAYKVNGDDEKVWYKLRNREDAFLVRACSWCPGYFTSEYPIESV